MSSLSFSPSLRNSRGIQPIAKKILKAETKLRSKSCSERLLNGSVLYQPTMQAFFKERASYLTDISQNSRPDNGGSAISRDESKTFVRSKNGAIVRIGE